MSRNRKQQRLIRERMARDGVNYTAARRQIITEYENGVELLDDEMITGDTTKDDD